MGKATPARHLLYDFPGPQQAGPAPVKVRFCAPARASKHDHDISRVRLSVRPLFSTLDLLLPQVHCCVCAATSKDKSKLQGNQPGHDYLYANIPACQPCHHNLLQMDLIAAQDAQVTVFGD